MKSKASSILKQIMAVLSSIAKAKSMAAAAAGVKSKTGQLKGRLTVVSLLMKNKKAALLGPISDKIKSLIPHQHHHHHHRQVENNNADETDNRAIVLYDRRNAGGVDDCWSPSPSQQKRWFRPPPLPWHGIGDGDDRDDDKYPDLTHTLFDEEDYSYLEEELEGCLGDDGKGSVIDMVKSSKALHEGEEFKLEDEIDHVANLFITRFHKQMRLQKLESFKRNQEMLARGL